MSNPLQRLIDVGEDQWGLITKRQAEQVGVGWSSLSRLVESGLLERVDRGVYRIRGAPVPDHLALRAAWLAIDPATPAWKRLADPDVAVVSHTSAASLHDVGDLRADVHELTVPVRLQTRRPDLRIHRGVVGEADRMIVHGLPVTRPGRTAADLLTDHVEPLAVGRIVDEVLTRLRERPSVIARAVEPQASRFGLPRGDGLAVLDHLLALAGSRDREALLREAGARVRMSSSGLAH